MDGKRFLNKCGTRVDWISQLPDDIIVHILSFLPLKNAGATSILSTRWLNLWKYTPKLNFVRYHLFLLRREIHSGKYVNWVNSVLNSHKALSLKEFTIAFLVKRSTQYEVTKWLEFAFLRRVERMDWISEYSLLKREEDVVHEEILNALSIQTSNYNSLKVLCFRCFIMSGFVVEFFLPNCRFLERLVLYDLIMTSDLEVVSGSLKHLDIFSHRSQNSIKVSAPNLIWLTVDHGLGRVSLDNVPNLVNMHFFCRYGHTMHDFAKIATQLETLIITLYHPTELFSVPQMPNLKKLVVYVRNVEENIRIPITCFLRASPLLEEFILEHSELDRYSDVFEMPKGGPILSHRHLKRFVLSGFCCGCDRIELVKYIVDNCVALEEIVVGQCDRIDLVRNIVDYCIPLDEIIEGPPILLYNDYVFTLEDRQLLEETLQQLQIPSRIQLRIVEKPAQ